jgi:metallo-beta-lactamase family protein
LLQWLGHFHHPPHRTCVVHGEAATARDFAELIQSQFGWTGVTAPEYGNTLEFC